MNTLIPISPNMLFHKDASFGVFNEDIIFGLLRFVDITFSKSLCMSPFSSTGCIISYNHDMECPMCCWAGEYHCILLHCEGNYWCQWLYQFAHEYCHHLIGGELSGEHSGLIWFEETVCELSSMFHLHNLASDWENSRQGIKNRFAPSIRDYLNNLFENPLLEETYRPGFLHAWANLLQEPQYQREHYKAIATRMFPLFVENPYLWKILLHFGNVRQWNSLEELFSHLEKNSNTDYSESLYALHRLLLS